jgi:long-chain fatty acid transport protein
MSRLNLCLASTAVSLFALLSAQSSAQAGAFAIREQSATGQGMSFAGVAAGSAGVSSMFWNPATITMKPGWWSELHVSAIAPRTEITPTLGTNPFLLPLGASGDASLDAVVPASYASIQLSDRLWIGLYTGAPFGLATKPGPVWSGQPYARTTSVVTYEADPTIGLKVNDWLSVGAGLRFQHFDVTYKSATGGPLAFTPGAPTGGLRGESFGFGYTLGATLTPFSGTQIGIGFRSAIDHELEGELNHLLPIKAKVVLPETVTFGIRQQVTDLLAVNGTVEWTHWSRLGFPRVYNVLSGRLSPVPALPLGYDDGWFFSAGAEYRFTPALTMRAGVGYEISPIDESVRSPRLADDDRIWLSAGASYQWTEKLSLDVGYSYIFAAEDTKIRVVPGNPSYNPLVGPLVAEVDSDAHILSLALKYRWDNPQVAIPATVVTRY